MARPDFRSAAARRLSEERDELSPAIVSLLSADERPRTTTVRQIAVSQIDPNPEQPRLALDQDGLSELTTSVREHGVLQPILVRPLPAGRYQLVAGERRWRAAQLADLGTIPALVEELDDATALEISIIENLQREDLSPLDEAGMYRRMIHDYGYSVRKLGQKLGKDKGYIENRLRLVDAPTEIRELVSLRKDTVSHAYELMKVEDPKRRKRLADQVARGELSLQKLRALIDGKPASEVSVRRSRKILTAAGEAEVAGPAGEAASDAGEASAPQHEPPTGDKALVSTKAQLTEAIEDLVGVLRAPQALDGMSEIDRVNLAKYLTITKLRLENAIALLRTLDTHR
ncbi:MAG: ParB/RepB/Spo0J family partition protein [Chloroflexi bacterium]|nr:ParB/RepB/Spo0J family partition protein [Chloroflexota bacterium]